MTTSHISVGGGASHRPDFLRWRRRSAMIRRLRVILPVLMGLIFATLGAIVVYRTATGGPTQPVESNAPIRLLSPRFVGRDGSGRPFVLTAVSAVRDDRDYARVILDRPTLVLGEGDEVSTIVSKAGVYREDDRMLQMSGGVELNGHDTRFITDTSAFNTKTGELGGLGPISGAGTLGEIHAKSYGVYDKGERMVFRGGVRARINTD